MTHISRAEVNGLAPYLPSFLAADLLRFPSTIPIAHSVLKMVIHQAQDTWCNNRAFTTVRRHI